MNEQALNEKKCEPCEGKTDPFTKDEAKKYLEKTPGWEISGDGKQIFREFTMKNFVAGVALINNIKDVAEGEDHHPDIHLTGYKNLKVELSTHAIGGLSENDFIVAAKINELPMDLKSE